MSLPAILGIIVSVLFIIFSFFDTHSWINPVVPFGSAWILVIILSLTNERLSLPNDQVYWIINIGMLSFFLGAILFSRIFKNNNQIIKSNCYLPNYILLDILAIICMCVFIKQHSFLLSTTNISSLGDTQRALQSGISTGASQLEGALVILIINPVSFAIPAITATDFWFGKRDKVLLFLTIVLVIVKVIATANRTSIFIFFLWLVVGGLLKNGTRIKDRLKHRHRLKIIIIGILSIVILSILSLSRGTSLIDSIKIELAIPPRMFEIWKNTVDNNGFYSYGLSTFMGILHPITYILKHTLGLPTPNPIATTFDLIQLTDTTWVWPGPHVIANAYVSFLWFFYSDFRIGGVIFFSLLSGLITMSIFKKIEFSNNLKLISVYCLIFYALFYSFVRMQTANDTFSLGLVFILLFGFRKRRG